MGTRIDTPLPASSIEHGRAERLAIRARSLGDRHITGRLHELGKLRVRHFGGIDLEGIDLTLTAHLLLIAEYDASARHATALDPNLLADSKSAVARHWTRSTLQRRRPSALTPQQQQRHRQQPDISKHGPILNHPGVDCRACIIGIAICARPCAA